MDITLICRRCQRPWSLASPFCDVCRLALEAEDRAAALAQWKADRIKKQADARASLAEESRITMTYAATPPVPAPDATPRPERACPACGHTAWQDRVPGTWSCALCGSGVPT